MYTQFAGNIRAKWIDCTQTLHLTRQTDVADFLNVSNFNFVVSGLRLPIDGVTPELALHTNISTNAVMGHIESENIGTVQLVGAFLTSSLTIAAPTLDQSSTNTFNLTFSLLSPLETGDEIDIIVPGVVFASGLTGAVTQYEPWRNTY